MEYEGHWTAGFDVVFRQVNYDGVALPVPRMVLEQQLHKGNRKNHLEAQHGTFRCTPVVVTCPRTWQENGHWWSQNGRV